MKKSVIILVALLLLSPLANREAQADTLTISATFGNLARHTPVVRHRSIPTVVVVEEPRWDRHDCYEKKSHRHSRSHHEFRSRHEKHRRHHREPAVVYYYPDYRPVKDYRY